jgi:hypothetical protein
MEVKRKAYTLLLVKTERKRPIGRPNCRLVDNIKMDFRETGWSDMT